MKFSNELNDSFCQQILIELQNQNKFSAVQNYFEELELSNLSGFFKKQSARKNDYANLFIDYVNQRIGGKVTIGEVNAPMVSFSSPEQVGEFFLLTEQQTTESIESLYELVLSERSYIDLPFLQNMLSKQVKREEISEKFALNIKMVKDFVLFDATFK